MKRLIVPFLVLLLLPLPSFSQPLPYQGEIEKIEKLLNEALETYRAGDPKKAKALVSEAYFDVFEASGMEARVGARSSAMKTELESLFGRIVGLMGSGAPPEEVEGVITTLGSRLRDASREIAKRQESPLSLLFNSFIIIVREGFEAILVISALAAYLVKIGRPEKVKTVYGGAGLALIASLALAIILQFFFSVTGTGKEALEGITMLIATGVLFYVSYWLISKAQVVKWQRYIKSMVEGSLSKGSVYTLALASFLAVFREGAETVLFYQALYSSANGGILHIAGGFLAGSLVLAAIFLVMRYGSVRIPIGPFFAITSTLLYYLAFVFAGKGIMELQEAGWIPVTPVKWVPTIGVLGIYPTLEGLSLQAILLLALLVALLYTLLIRPYRERGERLKEVLHIVKDLDHVHSTLEHIRHHARTCQELYPEERGNREMEEIRAHLREIDSSVHELMDHMKDLERSLTDIFGDLEKGLRRR